MSQLNTPNIFVQGTTINAAPFNVNFAAIQTAVNSIDNSNIGAAGLFPSQLLPTTAGQATFGGMIGYNFLAPTASTTPLTVSGVAGQSVDIFDVTLTSGGTKAAGITSTGTLFVGSAVAAGLGAGDISIAESATIGFMTFGSGTTAQTASIAGNANNLRFFPVTNGSAVLTATVGGVTSAGFLSAGAANPSTAAGDISGSRSASTAVYFWGSTNSTNCAADFGINNVGGLTFKKGDGSAFIQLFGTSFTNSSDVRLKQNVVPNTYGLATLKALKPSAFEWIENGRPDLGFIAQDVQTVIPEIVSTDSTGMMSVTYTAIIPVLVTAVKELAHAFEAYVAAHP